MTTQHQPNYNLPEYEILLSINLQLPIRIKPEISVMPLIYKDKVCDNNIQNYKNNSAKAEHQVDLNQLDYQFLPESMSPPQIILVKQIMAEVVFPEDFQHMGTIVREIVAKVVSVEDCESEYVQQVSVYRLPGEPVREIQYEKSLLSKGEQFLSEREEFLSEDKQDKLGKQPFDPTIKEGMPQEQRTIGRAMDVVNDSVAFVLNTTASVMFLGKVANYSWE